MRKFILSIVSFFLFSSLLWADPISSQQASRIARKFLNAHSLFRSSDDIHLTYTHFKKSSLRSTEDDAQAYYYIFNRGENDGFIVVAGDDRMYEVLAYSDQGHLDHKNLPVQAAAWFSAYEEQITQLLISKVKKIDVATTFRATQGSVAPLLEKDQIRWDQTYPYNSECPKDPNKKGNPRSATGCVATAMAQIMRYYKWPEQAEGSIKYVDAGSSSSIFGSKGTPVEREITFGTVYDWDNMPGTFVKDNPKETEQAKAMGILLRDVGYSVRMQYSADYSGAFSLDVLHSFPTFFKYKKDLQLLERNAFSEAKWKELIRRELDAARPIYYTGIGEGGHAFVCDGYNTDDFYHFNWGWSGIANGYFRLEALNPTYLGTGAGLGKYNFLQEIIIHISPNKDGSTLKAQEMTAPLAGVRYNFDSIAQSLKLDVTAFQRFKEEQEVFVKGFLKDDKGVILSETSVRSTIMEGNYEYTFSLSLTSSDFSKLKDGKYTFFAQWALSKDGEYKDFSSVIDEPLFVLLDVKGGEITSLKYDVPEVPIRVVEGSVDVSKLYAYDASEVRLSIENLSDREYYAPASVIIAKDICPSTGTVADCTEKELQRPKKEPHTSKMVLVIPPKSTKEFVFPIRGIDIPIGNRVNIFFHYPHTRFNSPIKDLGFFSFREEYSKAAVIASHIELKKAEEAKYSALVVNPKSTVRGKINTSGFIQEAPSFIIHNKGAKFINTYPDIRIVAVLYNPLISYNRIIAVSENALEGDIEADQKIEFTPRFDTSKGDLKGMTGRACLIYLHAIKYGDKESLDLKYQQVFVPNILFGKNLVIVNLVNDTALEKIENDDTIVYPTIANKEINIESKEQIESLEIYSLSGILICKAKLGARKSTFGVAHLSEGIYMLVLRKANSVIEPIRFEVKH